MRTIGEIILDTAAFAFLDLTQGSKIDAFRIIDVAVGVTGGDDLCTEGLQLLDSIERHITGAGDDSGLPGDGLPLVGKHFFSEVNHTVTGGFGTGKRTAPADTLTGQYAFPAVGELFVSAVKITDLTAAHTDITGRNVFVWPDVVEQLGHEGLTEGHHFRVGLSAGVEVRTALTAADRLTGQRILEDLLETEEVDDGAVDGGMEADPALVRAEGAVELGAVTAVDMDLAVIIGPADAEGDAAFRFHDAFQKLLFTIVAFVLGDDGRDRIQNFSHRLVEFGFARVPLQDGFHDFIYVCHSSIPLIQSSCSDGLCKPCGCLHIHPGTCGGR